MLGERRLARAVLADDRDGLAGRDREVDAPERLDPVRVAWTQAGRPRSPPAARSRTGSQGATTGRGGSGGGSRGQRRTAAARSADRRPGSPRPRPPRRAPAPPAARAPPRGPRSAGTATPARPPDVGAQRDAGRVEADGPPAVEHEATGRPAPAPPPGARRTRTAVPAAARPTRRSATAPRAGRVELGGRLVEDEDARGPCTGSRRSRPAAARRRTARSARRPARWAMPSALERRVDPRVHLARGHAEVLEPEGELLADGQLRARRAGSPASRRRSRPGRARSAAGAADRRAAGDGHAAPDPRPHDAGDEAGRGQRERRLAGAVRARRRRRARPGATSRSMPASAGSRRPW